MRQRAREWGGKHEQSCGLTPSLLCPASGRTVPWGALADVFMPLVSHSTHFNFVIPVSTQLWPWSGHWHFPVTKPQTSLSRVKLLLHTWVSPGVLSYKPQRNLAISWPQVAAKVFPEISHCAGLREEPSICVCFGQYSALKKALLWVFSNPFINTPATWLRWGSKESISFSQSFPLLTSPYCLKALQPEISKMYLLCLLWLLFARNHTKWLKPYHRLTYTILNDSGSYGFTIQ